MLKWCRSRSEFADLASALEPTRRAEEAQLVANASQHAFCRGCGRAHQLQVPNTGGCVGEWANLLEGMTCPACGLNGRMRAFCTVIDEILLLRSAKRSVIFERVTPLYRVLIKRLPGLVGCEYLGSDLPSGSYHSVGAETVRHEDISATSFDADSFDLVMHCDVLEHVAEMRTALSECLRILKPGGILAFTCPFFYRLTDNLVRARVERGALRHILPPIYHGNPVSEVGALVYTHPGWETFDFLAKIGFAATNAAVMYDPVEGVYTNACPFDDGHVWAVALVACKPTGQTSSA